MHPFRRFFSPAPLVLSILLAALAPASSGAFTVVVDASGGGDVTTIQAGVDRLRTTSTVTDTLIVRPGDYDETVTLVDVRSETLVILAPGGPSATRVREVLPLDLTDRIEVHGLEVRERVDIAGGRGPYGIHWFGSRLLGGVHARVADCGRPNFTDCEFRGPVVLLNFGGDPRPFSNLRFVNAPLYLAAMCGTLTFEGCSFSRAPDTLASVRTTADNWIVFRNCTFEASRYGVAYRSQSYGSRLVVQECRFTSLAAAALAFEDASPGDANVHGVALDVDRATFERCGQAVRWLSQAEPHVSIRGSSIRNSGGTAIEALVGSAVVENVQIDGARGHGIALGHGTRVRFGSRDLWIRNNRVRDAGGTGIEVRDVGGAEEAPPFLISGNVVSHGRRAGIDVQGDAIVQGSLVFRNLGDGIRTGQSSVAAEGVHRFDGRAALDPTGAVLNHVRHNTAALNGGAGIVYRGSEDVLVENNIAAGNGGAGIDVTSTGAAEVVCNDSWRNAGPEYAGQASAAGNLSADPRFCDVANHDYHLQSGSPCAPSNPCRQIGPLGVGCEAITVEAVARARDRGLPRGRASGRPIQVALLGGPLFDALAVDPATVRLGGALPLSHGGGPRRPTDVDGDGWQDLLLAFRTRDLAAAGDSALLVGTTRDGVPFQAWVSLARGGRRSFDWEDIALGARRLDEDEAATLEIPRALGIRALSPNPSMGTAALELALPQAGDASIDVYDLAGRRAWSRALREAAPGVHRITIGDARLATGVYLVVLSRGSTRVSTRWVVAR